MFLVSVQMTDNRGIALEIRRYKDGNRALAYAERLAKKFALIWKGVAVTHVTENNYKGGRDYSSRGYTATICHSSNPDKPFHRTFTVTPDPYNVDPYFPNTPQGKKDAEEYYGEQAADNHYNAGYQYAAGYRD